jgi:tetratricopeptide (TPR) repeat protein
MARIEKTVFISYRRTNVSWALAIFQNLNTNGFDVFFDFTRIAAGDFETVILDNIKARAHFLVLLTPSALDRCGDREDWLRREIETALDTKRNIVPLMLEGFSFDTPAIANQLTGKLAGLKRYNALNVPADFFLEAMDRLRQRYLNIALDAVIHPPSRAAIKAAEGQQAAADTAPSVKGKELTAQEWFERGFQAKDRKQKIRFYTEATTLKPDFAEAFYNRALVRQDQGDLAGALNDYTDAIRLNSSFAEAFYNRGIVRQGQNDLRGARRDYTEAIRLNPGDGQAFYNRGVVRKYQGDIVGALRDYNEAIRLRPNHASTFYNRALIFRERRNHEAAIADFQKYLSLGGGARDGDQAEVEQMIRDLRKEMEPQNPPPPPVRKKSRGQSG